MEAPAAHLSTRDEKESIFPDSLFKFKHDNRCRSAIEQSIGENLVIPGYLFDGCSPDYRGCTGSLSAANNFA